MSEEMEQGAGTTAVKALAAATATGAATYAVRKALASRNGHDEHSDDEDRDELESEQQTPDDSAEEDEDYDEEEEPEDSAEEDDEDYDDEEEPEDSAEEDDEDEPEASAEEDDEDWDDEDEDGSNGADRSSGSGSLRRLVTPSRLAGVSHLLLPLAGEAADSAGRYVAEHTSDTLQEQVVDRFIDAFKKAS